jgi:hypothetical protein
MQPCFIASEMIFNTTGTIILHLIFSEFIVAEVATMESLRVALYHNNGIVKPIKAA